MKLSVMVHFYNPSTQEAEIGLPGCSQPGLLSKTVSKNLLLLQLTKTSVYQLLPFPQINSKRQNYEVTQVWNNKKIGDLLYSMNN